MVVTVTEQAIRSAKAKAKETGKRVELVDAECDALRLRFTPPSRRSKTGKAVWSLMCRDRHGQMRRFAIGDYPGKGVKDARDAARALHVKVKQDGADPTAERRRERAIGKAAKGGVGTLAALLDLYGEKQGSTQKARVASRKRVELVFKPLLASPLAALTAADFQMLADAWPSAASAGFIVRTIRPALKWAAQRGYMPEEAARIHPPATVRRRKRVLSREELAAVLPVLRNSARPYAAAMRFMLLTLCRREEAGAARWRDLDFAARAWTIPETKNGESHCLSLPRQAIELLQVIRPEHAEPEALIFATATGGPLLNWDRETKALQRASKTAGWTRHDLRRTGATMLGEMGELPDIIEAALNHTSIRSPLAATYNRSRYRPQVALALQRLADALDGIEGGAGQVVPLHPATAWSG